MKIDLSQASSLLQQSQPIAIPTETVWGLAACLHDEEGIRSIFSLKGRPPSNPLIIHLPNVDCLKHYAIHPLPPFAEKLMETFSPGPLTLVLPCKQELIPSVARAGLPTAGFRIPKEPATLSLLEKMGPLVAPSANLSGRPSATESKHVEEDFGVGFPCLETDEKCHFGIESTILVYKEERWHVGRLGALSLEAIASLLGYMPLHVASCEKPLCPGQTFRHYAPRAKLSLSRSPWQASWSEQCDVVLGFLDRLYENAPSFIPLGFSHDPISCQHALYRALRLLDERRIKHAWVDCSLTITPAWAPFFDRLTRAAEC